LNSTTKTHKAQGSKITGKVETTLDATRDTQTRFPATKSMPARKTQSQQNETAAMILGVGSFAHSIGAALADAGAKVSTYLTRNYGHFPPSLHRADFFEQRLSQPGSTAQEKRR